MSAPPTTAQEVVRAAMSLARSAAEGTLSVDALDTELTQHCRALFGTVLGPADPLFSLQLDVARQVLATGAVSLQEISEWLVVLQRRQDGSPVQPPA